MTKSDLYISPAAKALLAKERSYTAGGFAPVPAFFTQAEGSYLHDGDGKKYIDFIAMFSAVNMGHCNPYIQQKVIEQIQKVSLVNQAGHSASVAPFGENVCQRFGYDKLLSLTSGTEAADTACKIARKWGIAKKGIPANECLILGVGESYHGLSPGVWGLQDPSPQRKGIKFMLRSFFLKVTNNLDILQLIMEPLHGTSRDPQAEQDYAREVYDLCKAHNILFIADEVRQGAGKTGKFFSFQHLGPDVRPDLVTMGKSITGGFYPQSFILGVDAVLGVVGSYEIGSSYAFSPVGVAAAAAALEVIDRERLMEKAERLGEIWRGIVKGWEHPLVDYVASIGADSNLFVVEGVDAKRLAALCMHRGLFLYPRPRGLRISFAMTMDGEVLRAGVKILKGCLDDIDKYGAIEGE
ncbi:pyridoxal phosphate-dependent transferase [Aspergillus karnatakaensis]|uniref:putative acetylornithine aminotransferase n=1 Tax=Aspergillus karnatakaensis TaxID=1810916 RepID=UPI003CCCCCAC